MTTSQILMGCAAFFAVLIENILRSTQNKNVAAGYTKAVFFTGGLMTLCDGIIMTIIATGGLSMLPFTVTASALGWVVGIKLHDYFTRDYREKIEAERKARKKRKLDKRIAKAIEKVHQQ